MELLFFADDPAMAETRKAIGQILKINGDDDADFFRNGDMSSISTT